MEEHIEVDGIGYIISANRKVIKCKNCEYLITSFESTISAEAAIYHIKGIHDSVKHECLSKIK